MKHKSEQHQRVEIDQKLSEKLCRCKEILRSLKQVAVALSGGVDSSLLLALATETLGRENVLAATAIDSIFPQQERKLARQIAENLGVELIEFQAGQLSNPDFIANHPRRCYLCKKMMLRHIKRITDERNIHTIITGSNADDALEHRPGRRAERELGVCCPLEQAGLTKQEIRQAARAMGLPNWNKPASACLATRIPYGSEITIEKLTRIEKGEQILYEMGFSPVRLRDHNQIARIEIKPEQFNEAIRKRDEIINSLSQLGYIYITLDLGGYYSGSMDRAVIKQDAGNQLNEL